MKVQKRENEGQADSDDGTMKDDKCAETEAAARAAKVATSGDEQREPGLASKPASKKRPQDRYRSTAALEMMMSGRLDEQGFEKFFADPPAALVVIKGLQRLAELKALPGRAAVEARGAGEGATGEPGMKNARIEAKCQKTQVAEGQRDSGHNPESGGENRSQFRGEACLAH